MKARYVGLTAIALATATLNSACSVEQKEIHVSELFSICATQPNASIARRIPVDTEFVDYRDRFRSFELSFSHYPGDLSQLIGKPLAVTGPLHIKILGAVDPSSHTYVIEFDSLGAVLPKAYGSVRTDGASSSQIATFLRGWHRCTTASLGANNSFKPKPLRGSA